MSRLLVGLALHPSHLRSQSTGILTAGSQAILDSQSPRLLTTSSTRDPILQSKLRLNKMAHIGLQSTRVITTTGSYSILGLIRSPILQSMVVEFKPGNLMEAQRFLHTARKPEWHPRYRFTTLNPHLPLPYRNISTKDLLPKTRFGRRLAMAGVGTVVAILVFPPILTATIIGALGLASYLLYRRLFDPIIRNNPADLMLKKMEMPFFRSEEAYQTKVISETFELLLSNPEAVKLLGKADDIQILPQYSTSVVMINNQTSLELSFGVLGSSSEGEVVASGEQDGDEFRLAKAILYVPSKVRHSKKANLLAEGQKGAKRVIDAEFREVRK